MKNISFTDRQIPAEAERDMRELLKEFSTLQSDALEIAITMLATSRSFTSFLRFVRDQGASAVQRTRLLDAGSGYRDALEEAEIDDHQVRVGWHSLLTPKHNNKGHMLFGAVTTEGQGIWSDKILEFLKQPFPGEQEKYKASRIEDDVLEKIIGLRSGFIPLFLADDALENMEGIALDSSYATPKKPDGRIIFTMHEKFSFVCGVGDLSNWLKTDDARAAYDKKIRIAEHKYPATPDDLKDKDPLEILTIEAFIRMKGSVIGTIPEDSLESSYLSALDRASRSVTPHLTWDSAVVREQLNIKQRILDLRPRT